MIYFDLGLKSIAMGLIQVWFTELRRIKLQAHPRIYIHIKL